MNWRRLTLAFVNLVPAFGVMSLAYLHFVHFWNSGGHWSISHLLLVFQQVTAGYFFIARQAPKMVSWKLWDVVVALIGTFAPSFFSLKNQGISISVFGVVLQIVGNILSLYAIVSLGRSIGILPANRGIQTRGMYRMVRHPMYLSYQIANAGYLINYFNFYNLWVFSICLLSQLLRVYAEERLLRHDSLYREYQQKVRWRFFPFVY